MQPLIYYCIIPSGNYIFGDTRHGLIKAHLYVWEVSSGVSDVLLFKYSRL